MGDAQFDVSANQQQPGMPAARGLRYDQPARPTCGDLTPAERLVLWTIRALAESQNNWSLVQREFWLRCGPARIERVLQGLSGMLSTLALHRRRLLCVRKTTSPRLSADEMALLALIAAAQREQVFRVTALVRWLVMKDGQEALATHVGDLAAGLAHSRIRLGELETDEASV